MSDDASEKQLGNLASITAAIEATRTEIRSVQIQTSTELSEARIQVVIPLNRVNSLERARIGTDHAEIVDNELRFELVIEMDGGDRHVSETAQSTSQSETGEDASDYDNEVSDQPEPESHQHTQLEDSMGQDDTNRDTGTAPAGEATSQSESGSDSQKSSGTDSQSEVPNYQDPERLAAVYDEDATFEEMRQQLDVDVTAQTVRKYMIKHGIHEPEPRPDRLLESIREAEFELMNSETDRQQRQTNDSTSTDEDSS